MGQQNSCKTLIGVHSTMHLMNPEFTTLLGCFSITTAALLNGIERSHAVSYTGYIIIMTPHTLGCKYI